MFQEFGHRRNRAAVNAMRVKRGLTPFEWDDEGNPVNPEAGGGLIHHVVDDVVVVNGGGAKEDETQKPAVELAEIAPEVEAVAEVEPVSSVVWFFPE